MYVHLQHHSSIVCYDPRKSRGSIKSPGIPSVRPSVSHSCQSVRMSRIRVWTITSLFEVGFLNYFTEMITILRRCVARKFGSLLWSSRSQNDIAAKSCPTHNFVIWSRIYKLIHGNDHRIKIYIMCRTQYLGHILYGEMSQSDLAAKSCPAHNFVFWIWILKLFTEIITILRQRVACNIRVATLKVKVTS